MKEKKIDVNRSNRKHWPEKRTHRTTERTTETMRRTSRWTNIIRRRTRRKRNKGRREIVHHGLHFFEIFQNPKIVLMDKIFSFKEHFSFFWKENLLSSSISFRFIQTKWKWFFIFLFFSIQPEIEEIPLRRKTIPFLSDQSQLINRSTRVTVQSNQREKWKLSKHLKKELKNKQISKFEIKQLNISKWKSMKKQLLSVQMRKPLKEMLEKEEFNSVFLLDSRCSFLFHWSMIRIFQWMVQLFKDYKVSQVHSKLFINNSMWRKFLMWSMISLNSIDYQLKLPMSFQMQFVHLSINESSLRSLQFSFIFANFDAEVEQLKWENQWAQLEEEALSKLIS